MSKMKLAHLALMILLIAAMILSLQSCSTHEVQRVEEPTEQPTSMFVIVEESLSWRIVYHKDTKVMYAVSDGSYNYGNFTLLVDADGKPLIYSG